MKVVIEYRNAFNTRKKITKAFKNDEHLYNYLQKLEDKYCRGIDYREIN